MFYPVCYDVNGLYRFPPIAIDENIKKRLAAERTARINAENARRLEAKKSNVSAAAVAAAATKNKTLEGRKLPTGVEEEKSDDMPTPLVSQPSSSLKQIPIIFRQTSSGFGSSMQVCCVICYEWCVVNGDVQCVARFGLGSSVIHYHTLV